MSFISTCINNQYILKYMKYRPHNLVCKMKYFYMRKWEQNTSTCKQSYGSVYEILGTYFHFHNKYYSYQNKTLSRFVQPISNTVHAHSII